MPPICINCDSQSIIGKTQSDMYNFKSWHDNHNTMKKLLSNGIISINYIKSKDNLADPLTKSISREEMCKLSRGMGLKPIDKLLT